MKKNIKNLVITAAVLCLIAIIFFIYNSKLSQSEEVGRTNKINSISVFTSILPQEYFVERIGGDRVQVQALVTPGSSPATYEPTPRQMAALSQSKIFFRIGVPFENAFVTKIEETNKELHIVNTSKGITLRTMQAHSHHESEHEENLSDNDEHDEDCDIDHEHNHEGHNHHAENNEHEDKKDGNDPHIWLSPRLVKIQARTIADTLIEEDPDGKTYYEENLAAFLNDLDELDNQLTQALAPVKGRSFMVFHPSWGYFADAYGLKQKAIEIEGKEPSAKQLVRVIEMAKDEDIHVIFVQPQFNMESADRIAESIDGVVVPIDPLARDYINNLNKITVVILGALQTQK